MEQAFAYAGDADDRLRSIIEGRGGIAPGGASARPGPRPALINARTALDRVPLTHLG